jgi:hypothetical protein
MKIRKDNWINNILGSYSILKHVIEGKMKVAGDEEEDINS